jgi:hypothetical protein
MKIAIFSESPADEAAIRILVEAILQRSTLHPAMNEPRSRGWPSVLNILPSVIKHLHYQTDAEALVVVADANGSEMHRVEHESAGAGSAKCRLCLLRGAARRTMHDLRALQGRAPLKVAIGLAIPAIEAWFCCGDKSGVNEAAWRQALDATPRAMPYSGRELKQHLYGTDRPSLEMETTIMVERVRGLSAMLPRLCEAFPVGFGSLHDEIVKW